MREPSDIAEDIGKIAKEVRADESFSSKLKLLYELEYKYNMIKTRPFSGFVNRKENILARLEFDLYKVMKDVNDELYWFYNEWLEEHPESYKKYLKMNPDFYEDPRHPNKELRQRYYKAVDQAVEIFGDLENATDISEMSVAINTALNAIHQEGAMIQRIEENLNEPDLQQLFTDLSAGVDVPKWDEELREMGVDIEKRAHQLTAEHISHEPGDKYEWICVCGNRPSQHGFYPCDDLGYEADPTIGAGWTGLYICDKCERIIDGDTLEVVGRAGEKEQPKMTEFGGYELPEKIVPERVDFLKRLKRDKTDEKKMIKAEEGAFNSELEHFYELEYKYSMLKNHQFTGMSKRKQNILNRLKSELEDVSEKVCDDLIEFLEVWLSDHPENIREYEALRMSQYGMGWELDRDFDEDAYVAAVERVDAAYAKLLDCGTSTQELIVAIHFALNTVHQNNSTILEYIEVDLHHPGLGELLTDLSSGKYIPTWDKELKAMGVDFESQA